MVVERREPGCVAVACITSRGRFQRGGVAARFSRGQCPVMALHARSGRNAVVIEARRQPGDRSVALLA